MGGMTFLWLGASTVVFVAANGFLKTYAAKGGLPVLIGALALFCLGNWLMVQVMRLNGLGLAIAMSLIFQLVAITAMAFVVFGERPTPLQLAGVALGVVAVALIAWPTGGKA
jgi:drug/metabolite transporter (DMT)-like permease